MNIPETETVELYFKQVYTCKTKYYNINLDFTIKQLINYVKSKAHNDFSIGSSYRIEVVEGGQFNNVNGRDAELAPALDENSDTTLREKYGDNIKHKAFYIRPKLFIIIPDSHNNENDVIHLAPRT